MRVSGRPAAGATWLRVSMSEGTDAPPGNDGRRRVSFRSLPVSGDCDASFAI